MINSDKLSALIKNCAKGNNNVSLHLHQMFFFEKIKYKDNIILKEGVLLYLKSRQCLSAKLKKEELKC